MKICYQYRLKWRYKFNNSKIDVVTFGETKPMHSKLMHDRTWMVGDASVDELYEYKNLAVIKNFAGSFSTNVDDNIDKLIKRQRCRFQLILIAVKMSSCVCEVLEASLFTSSLIWL